MAEITTEVLIVGTGPVICSLFSGCARRIKAGGKHFHFTFMTRHCQNTKHKLKP